MITLLPDHLQTLFNDLRRDIDRYVVMDNASWLLIFLTKPGLWVLTQYRCSRWVDQQVHLPIIRFVLKVLCAIWQKLIEIITCNELPNKANIALVYLFLTPLELLFITKLVLVKIVLSVKMLLLVLADEGKNEAVLKLAIGFLLGLELEFWAITIGNDVAIGANAVVTKDLPDQAVAVGIPAKIISYEGSQDWIILGADHGIKKEIS